MSEVLGPGSAGSPAITGAGVSFRDATRLWWRVGWLSFGGPTAQIALMHKLLVDERHWLDEREFLDALGFCMLLPGPEAMQLATYAGWKLHGVRGGLVAGTLFVLPGACVVLALSITYAFLGSLPAVQSAFAGIQAAVLALVVQAMLKLSRRALTTSLQAWVAVASFAALFVFGIPFPAVVLAALMLGWLWPSARGAAAAHAASAASNRPRVSPGRTIRTAIVWLAIWFVPLLAVELAFGPSHLLSQLAWFFSRLAVITFGGAYAVLAWMSQDVVSTRHWLTASQMIDGLGLAETTPGPLILVTEFVGFLAAFRAHPGASLAYGLGGAAIAVWATFVPCLLWIFTGAPYVVRLREQPRLRSGLHILTAAVLGVIANLALWFALHVLFADVHTWRAGVANVLLPAFTSLRVQPLVLAALAGVLLWRGWSVHRVLTACALLAWIASAFHLPR